jgi:L-alanine-DL-glutamate epimerase-like enolase superfamily enzyme
VRVSLHSAELRYDGNVVVYTALSGAIPSLAALYLRLDDGEHVGIGEVRTNIAYVNGLSPEAVAQAARRAIANVDWSGDPAELLATMGAWAADHPAPVRMLIDGALNDIVARRAGKSVAAMFGVDAPSTSRTNHTLFWSPFDTFQAQVKSYVERGFRDLKVRIAVSDIGEDIRRLETLRRLFGDRVKIAVDANGAWSADDAPRHLSRLAAFDLAYVEQPIAAGDWNAIARLAEASPIPIMLDESVGALRDVERACELGGLVSAHLKLVKLGGIAATIAAARALTAAGVPIMIGQMNEGAGATAAALQAAVATAPAFMELYGADGLNNDPVSGLTYRDGQVQAEGAAGLGVDFDVSKTQLLQEL